MSILERMKLDGKVALVTGGARGIGRCVATGLAEAGAAVAIVDLDLAEAEKTAAAIAGETGAATLAVHTDVTDPDDAKKMVETVVARFGRLDIAFLNAGICCNEPAESMSYANWKKVIDVNLTGVFLTAQAAGAWMIANQVAGSLICTASMSGHIVNQPQPQCAYNASKAGVIMLVKSLAVEWTGHHIRVNSISPGYIATDMTKRAKQWIPDWNRQNPSQRLGLPEELQSAVLYLASDASSYTTGCDIIVDGAFTCV
ncbi:MAG TPA: short-chain dehydrogenase [Clostridiales bacterium]|nr:short-chain dehydrogenase [Clostridiales bacterium]